MKQTALIIMVISWIALVGVNEAFTSEKGKVRVAADQKGADIFVNGQKKAIIGAKGEYTDLLLPAGEYMIELKKTTADIVYVYLGGKKIFVEANASVKIEISTMNMKFVLIKPGTFMMGSPSSEPNRDNDEIQHKVTISKSFFMQSTEVTQAQWKAVMGSNPSHFKDCGDECPVENVSWDEVQQFIRKLNKMTGKTYRLPTEAEWEYAARAGTTTPFNTGTCLSTSQANYDGNYPLSRCAKGEYRKKTVPTASFSPNAWGLYDMHGNVWEWIQDWYGNYPSGQVIDPTGPSSGSSRVNRGGGWYSYAKDCRSASRGSYSPGNRIYNVGFRLAYTEVQQSEPSKLLKQEGSEKTESIRTETEGAKDKRPE